MVVAMTQRPCLYLVEDNLDIRKVFAMILEARGFEVCEFSTGNDALNAFSNRIPDVGLIDIGLPDINGWKLAERVREIPGGGRTVLAALTGRDGCDSHDKSLAVGFQLHFVKPVEIRDVCEKLFEELEQRRKQDAA